MKPFLALLAVLLLATLTALYAAEPITNSIETEYR